MAFQLAHGHHAAGQLVAILEEELAGARQRLHRTAPDAVAIHDARVRLKRMRAVLRLFEMSAGPAARRIAARLRRAAHALAGMREADACLESLTALERRYRPVLTTRVADRVRRGLEHRRIRSRREAEEALDLARASLASADRHLGQLAARPSHLRRGAVRAYRRARRAMLPLRLDAGDADFHRWRIRLKDHYYHMRLLEDLDPAPRRRARTLHTLEECLGDDHNLTVLQELLLTDPGRYGPARDSVTVLGCIAREQRRLRTEALRLGERVFAAKGARFATELAEWWGGGADLVAPGS